MAESRVAVAANFTTARASAKNSFFFESAAPVMTASERTSGSRGKRRDLSPLDEGEAAAAAQRGDNVVDAEINAIKPLVCLLL